MLKNYVEKVKRLSTDQDGVVSFEYVVVAACVVAVVITAFSTGGSLPGALTTGSPRSPPLMAVSDLSPERGIGMSQCHASFEACI